MARTADPWVGRVVAGRYQVTGTLGHGGMGTVYEAEQLGLERYVALKVLHPHVAKTPGAILARPVALIEPEGPANPHGIGTALSVAGYRVVTFREDDSLEGMHALVVVPRSNQAQEEALALASTLATRPHAPPVLLCGSGEDFTLMSRAIASGVYDYVSLPVDPTDLARKVGRALRSRR